MMFAEARMRTTLDIDDDLLRAAKELARSEHKTLGEKISELARQALQPPAQRARRRNGVPLLAVRRGGARVTTELVRKLEEELP
jgi:mRNA-degrading endonuclease RelE of RelBE toxin-antitoxin system